MNQVIIITILLLISIIALIIVIIGKNKKIEIIQTEIDDLRISNDQSIAELDLKHLEEVAKIRQEFNSDILAEKNRYSLIESRYSGIIDLDQFIQDRKNEIEQLKFQFEALNKKYQDGLNIYNKLENEISIFRETLEIGEFGLYEPKYNFEYPEQYKVELESVYLQQRALISTKTAITCNVEWEVRGSKDEGKRMTRSYMKLMLFAFNGECDALIAKVNWNNINRMEERIRNAFTTINNLGQTHAISIEYDYLQLKLQELNLTYEYELKKQEQKEEQRRIREQMREEEKAQKEFERAEREAEEEEKRFAKALEKAKKELNYASSEELESLISKIKILEQNLQEAHEKKERAISLSQMTKVGHIYVISNIGSFGEDVFKIGMTRRLDPMDRIRELGDASVPFQFDVHAIIYSENAPQLEFELHKRFSERRLNRINNRKEFFKTTLDDIEAFVKEHSGAEIEFTKLAEAREYRETLNLLESLKIKLEPTKKDTGFPASILETDFNNN